MPESTAELSEGPIQHVTLNPKRLLHGTRASLRVGDEIAPAVGAQHGERALVWMTTELDAAIWAAELADGDGAPRVYEVRATGVVEADPPADAGGPPPPPHPSMRLRSESPLVVVGEVTTWQFFHGTRAPLAIGDLITVGQRPNFGSVERTSNWVYFTRTMDAATWGAELALGEGPGRIYVVEPTGAYEEDPNLTDKKFRGNPTKSYRSRAPLRVIGEVREWTGHPPAVLQAMKDGLARLAKLGVAPEDD